MEMTTMQAIRITIKRNAKGNTVLVAEHAGKAKRIRRERDLAVSLVRDVRNIAYDLLAALEWPTAGQGWSVGQWDDTTYFVTCYSTPESGTRIIEIA